MIFFPYFRIKLLLIIVIYICISSCTIHNPARVPENTSIKYGQNDVPTYIKGENLSLHLEGDRNYQILKEKDLYGDMAYYFLESWHDLLKINNPKKDFEIVKIKIDDINYKHVKLRQTVRGIPAWGKEVIVHFNQNDAVYLFQGNYEPTPLTVKTIPEITPEKAKEIAILKASQETAKWNATGSELYIWFEDSDEPLLVYKVTLIKDLLFEIYYFVDSSNGNIVHKLSGTVD